MPGSRNTERLLALVVAAALAFNYPLLYLFADGGTLFGWPLLVVYLFSSWLMVIVLTALLMERGSSRRADASSPDEITVPDD